MPPTKIRAHHEQLKQIAQTFGREASSIQTTTQNLRQKLQTLEGGDWKGDSASKFFSEMNGTVLPKLKRLSDALEQAQQISLKISAIMKQAEADAAAIFKAQAKAGTAKSAESGGGFWSQVGGFFSGVWEGAKGMVGGLYHMVAHPIDTLKGLAYGVTHPGQLWDALKKPFVDDWQSGNYGRAIGRGAFEVGMLLIPGLGEAKAVGKGAEVANIAGKTAEVAEAANAVAKGGKVAEVAGEAGRVAELADVASAIARNERLAAEALASADKASEAARAADVFTSAQKALNAPKAAEAISVYKAADAGSIPGLVDSFGGSLGRAGDLPAELAGRRVSTLGRLAETGPAGEAGARILQVPGKTWSPELNALWVKEAVNNGDVFKLATEVSDGMGSLAGKAEYGGISVYTRELSMLKDAGYTRVGDFLVPPL